ncbi:MAG: hypothetical protein COX19_11950 [Desulfobacterales bacterium CG23_combo_of_CG06-09_8_20_14_all_51_8]|nr:MAG: hypothetical protein COX19_11950 [Desulfobacterales bacterium CG23_combo_of_CG06-09_8_20_14_all_51_8]
MENPLTVENVTANMTVYANFRQIEATTYTVNFIAGSGGHIDGQTTQTIVEGSDCTAVEAVWDEGYEFVGWTGSHQGMENPLTVENVTADMTIYANFRQIEATTYTVKFIANAGGRIDGKTLQTVAEGDDCAEVRAVALSGYTFDGWTGDYAGSINPLTISNVTSNMTVYANFRLQTDVVRRTVLFLANPGGHIDGDTTQTVVNGGDCQPVTAVPEDGYEFKVWTGGYSSHDNPLTIRNVTMNMTVRASFQLIQISAYTMKFTAGAGGRIDGILTQTVTEGGNSTEVRAVPDDGYDFIGWTGGHEGMENPLILTGATADKNIMANFRIKTYNVSIASGDGGSIDGDVDQEIGHDGATATITAVPETGYHFVGWSGDYTGTENPLVILNVTSDMRIVAIFEINTYHVVFTTILGGHIVGQSDQIVAHGGSSTPVTAEPETGYVFSHWSGDASGAANPLTLENVISDMTVTADFSVNDSPDTPELISPIDNAAVDPTAVTLVAGIYADTEDDAHVESTWQIWRTGETSPFYSISSSADLTEHVPGVVFENGVQYQWRVGFVDAGSRLISWSVRETFIAGTSENDGNIPPVPPGFTMKDYRLMSFIQWSQGWSFLNILNTMTSADTDSEDFKIGTYNPLTGGYEEYPDLEIEPGRAYWILARYGMTLAMDGVFVSVDRDFTLKLGYDEANGNGWNMIGSPNDASYLWYDLEVVETDDQGDIIFGPVSVSLLPVDNEYIDKRIWRWEDGGYTADNSDSFVLRPYEGAWVKARKKNIALVFPVSAQSGLSAMYLKAKDWADGFMNFMTPAYAGHADDDSPPMPMGVSNGGGSSGGCFIEVMSERDKSGWSE